MIRWQHPEYGLIPPLQFIPVAESCGLIVEIGRWVLREACSQALEWRSAGLDLPSIAVNVSATEIHQDGFIQGVEEILADVDLSGTYLEMEITERVLMDDAIDMARGLRDLRQMGIRVAIDDFGTGYSGLSYLNRFPINTLKIDRSFIQELSAGSNDAAILNAIIAMGKSLNYLVVAEGIETEAQKDCLQDMNCAEGQGFLFSRPLPAPQVSHLLRAGAHHKPDPTLAD